MSVWPGILVVCTGNICRSPLGATLLEDSLSRDPAVAHTAVFSAGTHAQRGAPATSHAIQVAGELGLKLHEHRSQPVTAKLLEQAHYVLGMTKSHLHFLSSYLGVDAQRLHLFRSFSSALNAEVPDPYGSDLAVYRDCLEKLQAAVPAIIHYLKKNDSLT